MCLNKTIIIVILGTLLEWMEFSFFAYMTDYLSGVFFWRGGTALIANEFLVSMTRAAWCSGFYMSMCALVCLVVLKKFAMKKV